MSWFFKGLLAILATLYPFAVYFGLQFFSPRIIAACLLGLLLLRLFVVRKALMMNAKSLLMPLMFGVIVAATVMLTGDASQLTLMPVIITAGFLLAFLYSLFFPPSIVEVLARLQDPDLPPKAIAYTRKVTIAWCLFFIVNGSISFYTHATGDMQLWTLYNGFLAYIFIAAFAGAEWLIRQRVKASHLVKNHV